MDDAQLPVEGMDLLEPFCLILGESRHVAPPQLAVAVGGLAHAPAAAHVLVRVQAPQADDNVVGLGDHVEVVRADLRPGQC